MNFTEPSYVPLPATQTSAWTFFTYVSFACSFIMVTGGILALPLDVWMRGYLAIGVLLVVQSSFTLSKTLRDAAEQARLLHRVENVRTEKMLMGQE
jgi:hypothetical protein